MPKATDDAINKLLKEQGLEDVVIEGVGEGKNGGARSVGIHLRQATDQKLIERALNANDEGTTILLLTLEIEHQLSLLLESITGSKNNARDLNSLVLMLKVLRFENDIFQIVDGFRRLRNKFAHEKNATLSQYQDITNSIFSCKIPSPTEDIVEKISEGEKYYLISELDTLPRLSIYANVTIIFIAAASQIYTFPKPRKRIVVSSQKLPDLK
jgi:hypothetical protein